jgi:hypothetical protein
MHSAPSRIIPMYPEEGALHEIGDAGGGKRVKDRAMLILSQFPCLCTARAAMAQADLLCVRRPSRTWFSSSTRRSNADETACVDRGMLRGGHPGRPGATGGGKPGSI